MSDYDDIDCLLDTDPIHLAERCRESEAALTEALTENEDLRWLVGHLCGCVHHGGPRNWMDFVSEARADLARRCVAEFLGRLERRDPAGHREEDMP